MSKKPSPYDDPAIRDLPQVKSADADTAKDSEFDPQNPIVKPGKKTDPKTGITTKHN